jgi:DNA-binding NarL/FixJ family response regulator
LAARKSLPPYDSVVNGLPSMVNIVETLRILIADDHQLFRDGVRALLQSHAGWEICGEASTGREAVAKTIELRPDVIILDISMPDLNGADAARRIRMASKNTEILILSVHYSDQLIREIIDSGARGYVLKSDSDHDLLIAVETLARHKPFFTSKATKVIQNEFIREGTFTNISTISKVLHNPLSSREREIVQLLAEGKNSGEVSLSLGVSVKTVESHRANIMRKLEMHNISELVRYAVRNKIIEP